MMNSMTTPTNPTDNTVFLDLSEAISVTKNTILTGKERGESARVELGVDALYRDNEVVVISVPENVIGISSSFINGLMSGAVKAAGGFDEFFPRLVVKAPQRIVANIISDLKRGDLPPLRII